MKVSISLVFNFPATELRVRIVIFVLWAKRRSGVRAQWRVGAEVCVVVEECVSSVIGRSALLRPWDASPVAR